VGGLTVALQGSYNNAVLTQGLPTIASNYGQKGDQLPYSIRASGGVSVNEDIHLFNDWMGFVGASAHYVGSRPTEFLGSPPPASYARSDYPAYSQFNFHGGVHYESWVANLYINNVADRRGIVRFNGSSGLNAPGGYYTTYIQPRTIGISVAKSC
jgi:iron complex outermembrane receptor protein